MKTPLDPRHKKRQILVEELFKYDFYRQRISKEAEEIIRYKKEIDIIIEKAAPEFPIEKINKTDLAILRLAVFELLFKKETPAKVVIDEAIELAKEFGGETSPSFINGALGNVVNKKNETNPRI